MTQFVLRLEVFEEYASSLVAAPDPSQPAEVHQLRTGGLVVRVNIDVSGRQLSQVLVVPREAREAAVGGEAGVLQQVVTNMLPSVLRAAVDPEAVG